MPLLGVRKPHGDMYSFLHRSASTIEGKRRLEEGVTDHMLRMSRPIELSVFRTTDQLSQPIFAFFFFFFPPELAHWPSKPLLQIDCVCLTAYANSGVQLLSYRMQLICAKNLI
jgi:hypothetical protein